MWIKRRLLKYKFAQENVNYTVVNLASQSCEARSHGGHNQVDYIITLELAKHICMMEDTEKGIQIRNYFIQCEKDLTLALEERLQKLELQNKMNKDKFSKKEMNNMFQAMFNIIELADELHTDIEKVDELLGSIHKREEYIAMFSDNVKYFAKDKFDGEIYKGNKFCKMKPRSCGNDGND